MARIVDLTGENMSRQRRKDRQYGTKTDMSSTTVDRGDTHWMNGSRVSIDGVLDVTGTTTISGALNVSGTTTLSGSTTIAGPTGITGALTIAGTTSITGQLDVTGPTTLAGTLDITGDTSITGALGIEGDTTLTGDMDVIGGGRIKVGTNMTLTPVTGGGAVDFANGASLASSGTAVELSGGGSAVSVSSAGTQLTTGTGALIDLLADGTWAVAGGGGSLMANGSGVLDIGFAQTNVNGNAKITGNTELLGRARVGNPYSTGNAPNVYMDANGWLYRTSWTP